MPYSYNTTVASGMTAAVSVPFPFITRDHVHVEVAGVQVADNTLSWVNDGLLNLPTIPGAGEVIKVYRATPADDLVATYSDPAVLASSRLNSSFLQLLYVVQEAADGSQQAIEVSEEVLDLLAQVTSLALQAQASEDAAAASAASAAAAVASAAMSTGDIKLTLKTVADTGWVMMDDGTIGNTGSGAGHTGSTYQALFNLLYASPFTDSTAPLLTSAGAGTTRAAQGSAAAAWAAGCRMSLTKVLGRALAAAGAGSGLTTRAPGDTVGVESRSLGTPNVPAYTPQGSVASSTQLNWAPIGNSTGATSGAYWPQSGGGTLGTGVTTTSTFTGTPEGGTSTAFGIIDPTAYVNVMLKL